MPDRSQLTPGWTHSRYGGASDSLDWKQVQEEYYWDRLEGASRVIEEIGVGFGARGEGLFRTVDAEYQTRIRSQQKEINRWLSIEWIPDEVELDESIISRVVEACDHSAKLLGWNHEGKVLLTILAEEVDAPWTDGRYGYMVDKYPFDKICIPRVAWQDRGQLRVTMAHEYAHVVTLNVTQGKIPRWLDEGIAMTMEGRLPNQPVPVWHKEAEVLQAFQAPQDTTDRHFAYLQSLWIVRYLVSLGGEAKLGDLLRGFSNNSTFTELKMAVTSQSPADEALREVYGFGVHDLFERAHQAMVAR